MSDWESSRGPWQAIGALSPGQLLGQYELLLPVARGGMAVVWAARDTRHDGSRVVALKTMLPVLSDDARFHRMFEIETEIASKIRNPNVCQVLDSGRDAEVDYLVMEWIAGEPISALLAGGSPLPFGVAARIALDAAEGLQAAHALEGEDGQSLGIVHRDVSPQNVLLTPDGVAKIADFGIAKATQLGGSATLSGSIKGKVDYLSPEQAFSEPLDGRSDVFALGAVLYEMTTGRRPFGADSQMATLVKLTSAEPAADPTLSDENYPAELAAVVMRSLDKDKASRYPTMQAFADDLAQALRGLDGNEHGDVARFQRSVGGDRMEQRARAIERALTAPPSSRSESSPAQRAGTAGTKGRRAPWRPTARTAIVAAILAAGPLLAIALLDRQPSAAPAADQPHSASISDTPRAPPAGREPSELKLTDVTAVAPAVSTAPFVDSAAAPRSRKIEAVRPRAPVSEPNPKPKPKTKPAEISEDALLRSRD